MLIEQEYRAGTLSTSQMKEECIAKIQDVVGTFQAVSTTQNILPWVLPLYVTATAPLSGGLDFGS